MISVIMPAYNAERYIANAVASVLAQDHTDIELLVVDNNSTDGTVGIIKGFNDPRVRLLHQPVQGVSAARNKALEMMRGEIFCFLDADDEMPQGSLQARYRVLLSDPKVSFADGTVEVMDANMQHSLETWRPVFVGIPYEQLVQLSPSCFFASTWMIRREPGRSYRFPEHMTHAEDLFFLLSISRDGWYSYTTSKVLRYRRGHASAMKDLVGLHQGYRDLVLGAAQLPDPPDDTVLDGMWHRVKRIMWRSYLKRGMAWRSFRAALENRPKP
ncbi:MAG: glycosyltransferase family 2 protein [Flavobacteriales bacterium]